MDLEGRRFVSVKFAARYLSVHEMTVRSWINEGRIPCARIGRSVRVDLKVLTQQLEAQAAAGVGDGKGTR